MVAGPLAPVRADTMSPVRPRPRPLMPSDRLPYADLAFPAAPPDRPYVFINMVATIDGKILTGERDEPVMDLGSKADHAVMRRLESAANAVMLGAGSLRATPGLWYPEALIRVVVSESGNVPRDGRFFSDAPDRAYIATNNTEVGAQTLPLPLRETLRVLRQELRVERLLCEGGSELNAHLIAEGVADELFLTLAPKVKLGRDVPTYADGEPLPRSQVQNFELIELTRLDDEVFLRYRRAR